jgi:hypothetical protein
MLFAGVAVVPKPPWMVGDLKGSLFSIESVVLSDDDMARLICAVDEVVSTRFSRCIRK